MNKENIHTEGTFLSLAQDLLENRDPEVVRARLEELKGIVAPFSQARRARYARALGEAAEHVALEALEGQTVDPISQAAFQALEELEARSAQLPFLFLEAKTVEPEKQPSVEDLTIIAARIDTADTPEIIRAATNVLLDNISAQEGLFEQTLYCVYGLRLMEDKILMETLRLRTSPALSLWEALRRSPSEALAIALLWYDGETGLFHSAAPEELASKNTPEELRKGIAIYEDALRLIPLQERILYQRELCRAILRQAGVWLMEQGLEKEPLFRLFTQIIRQYLWGDLSLLNLEETNRDMLIPPLVLRLFKALDEQKIPVPPVLSRLLRLCIGIAMDYGAPAFTWMLEEDEKQ